MRGGAFTLHRVRLNKLWASQQYLHKMHPSQVDPKNATIGDLQSNARGGKTAQLLANGQQIRLKLLDVTTRFNCSSFDQQSTRRALGVRTDSALRDFCERLDNAVLPLPKTDTF